MRTTTHDLTAAWLLAAVLAAPAVPALAAQQVDRTVTADPDATVSIETLSGRIEIRGWDRSEVRVTGTVGDDTDGLSVKGDGDFVSIEVEIPEFRGRRRHEVDADLSIDLPRGARVEVETVSASIDVTGVDGELELDSVSGNVTVEGAPELAELETVSGSIRLDGAARNVSAEAVSGSVRLRGVTDRVEASSVSGPVEIEAGELTRAKLETVSASISLTGTLAARARVDVDCHSGNVTLRLPGSTSARFDVSTFSGNIENEFGPEAKRQGRYTPEKALEFSIGDGSAEVSIETFSGNVYLRRQ